MSKGVLVFDLDGTLVPTMDDYADQAAREMEQAFGTPWAEGRASYFATSGLPFFQQLRQLYPGRPETDDVAERFEAWKNGYVQSVSIAPTTVTLLEQWRAMGWKVAISSNNMARHVAALSLRWPVDMALGFRAEDGFAKGEAHFAAIEGQLEIDRARFVFIGDSPNDARIAAHCGVAFRALLTPAFTIADFQAVDADIIALNDLTQLTQTLPR